MHFYYSLTSSSWYLLSLSQCIIGTTTIVTNCAYFLHYFALL